MREDRNYIFYVFMLVAERKNFKLLFSAGIIFDRCGFEFIYFVQWEGLRPFCPSQHKRQCIAPSTSSLPHILFESDRPVLSFSLKPAADHITMRRAHLIYGQLVPRNLFYINPPRPTAPRRIKLDVLFRLWHQHFNSCSVFSNPSFVLITATRFLFWH